MISTHLYQEILLKKTQDSNFKQITKVDLFYQFE